MVTKLTSERLPVKLFNENAKLSRAAMENGGHPYNKEPESIPVAVGLRAHNTNTEMSHTLATTMTPYGPGIQIRGREYLKTLITDTNTYTAGNGMLAIPLNPRVLYTSRLQLLSKLYTRFIFKEFNIVWAGMPGTQTNGTAQLFGVYDPDVAVGFKPGDPLVGFAENSKCADVKLWDSVKLNMNDSHYKDMLYIDAGEDIRWSMQGVAYITSGGTIPATTELAKAIVEYDIVLASDMVDVDEVLPQRGYSTVISYPNIIIGTTFAATSSAPALLPGRYVCMFRGPPSSNCDVYMNSQAYALGTNAERTVLAKGQICWITVQASGVITFYAKPTIWNDIAGQSAPLVAAAAIVAGTIAVDVYKFADA